MENKLTEINQKDLPLLRSLYKPNEPDSYLGYTTIDFYIRWFDLSPSDTVNNDKIKFYCLNDDFERGTFIVTDDYTHTAYADTLCDSTDELLQLLLLIDYSQGHFFHGLSESAVCALKEVLNQKNIEHSDQPDCFYRLPKEKALEYDVQPPDGIELKPLSHFDLKKAFSVWPGRVRSSLRLFECAAQYHMNMGAFKTDGTLVAWCLRWPNGLHMALQTDKDHYGHGYGTLVKKTLSKKIARTGWDVYTSALETNIMARCLYEKLGFEEIKSKKYWLCTKINWRDE